MTEWKKVALDLLKEENHPTDKYKLYCDLDGVLVNFEKGAEEIVNAAVQDVRKNWQTYLKIEPNNHDATYKKFKFVRKLQRVSGQDWDHWYTWDEINKDNPNHYKPMRDLMYFLMAKNQKWWEDLEWAPGGKELWAFIEKYEPTILSSGMGERSVVGKQTWCQKHLGLSGNRVIITPNKGVPVPGGKVGILIDDRTKSLGQFKGIGIRYVTGHPQDAIESLRQYGFE